MSTTISQGVKLDTRTRERLQALAQLRDRSPHYLMKTAIETYLEREESYEREKREDAERWERYALTGEAVSHERAGAWLQRLSDSEVAPAPR